MAVRVHGIEEQTAGVTAELIQTRLMDKLEEEIGQLNTKIT